MADLQYGVRELERRFYEEYYLEVFEQVKLIPEMSRKMGFLHNIISSNSSEWSGGHSATNMEERIKRDIAIDIMRTVINMMTWEEVKSKQQEAV
jgi:hypothetical protein